MSSLLLLFPTLMDNESQPLRAMVSTLSMGALKCIAHLLPLLHLLRFVINACNKCVTLALVVINGNENPRLFSNFSEPLELMASFYCLPTTIRSLVPIRYSLAILGIKCFFMASSIIDFPTLCLTLNSI